MKEDVFFGINEQKLHLYIWDDVAAPTAILQIVHDEHEYTAYYEEFARSLNNRGVIVIGVDNRYSGRSIEFTNEMADVSDCFNDIVEDNVKLGCEFKEKYGLPLYLFGQGVGATISERYIQLASDHVSGVVLSGSAVNSKWNSLYAKIRTLISGRKYGEILVEKHFNRKYNRKYKSQGAKAWLSSNELYVARVTNDPLSNIPKPYGYISSMNRAMSECYKEANISTIRKNLPILIMTGSGDPMGNFGKSALTLYNIYNDSALTNVKLRVYNGARHALTHSRAKEEVLHDTLSLIDGSIGQQN